MDRHDIDHRSVACSPLSALSKYRQRQTGTICSGPVSARCFPPYFPPPFELRCVVANRTGSEISFFSVSLTSTLRLAGSVRSAPVDRMGSAPLGVPLGFESELELIERAVWNVRGGGHDSAAAAAANQKRAQVKWAGLTE